MKKWQSGQNEISILVAAAAVVVIVVVSWWCFKKVGNWLNRYLAFTFIAILLCAAGALCMCVVIARKKESFLPKQN